MGAAVSSPALSEDYYAILEVKRDATPEEILRSYRHLEQTATEAFHQFDRAYRTLSDVDLRRDYDRTHPTHVTERKSQPKSEPSRPCPTTPTSPSSHGSPTHEMLHEPRPTMSSYAIEVLQDVDGTETTAEVSQLQSDEWWAPILSESPKQNEHAKTAREKATQATRLEQDTWDKLHFPKQLEPEPSVTPKGALAQWAELKRTLEAQTEESGQLQRKSASKQTKSKSKHCRHMGWWNKFEGRNTCCPECGGLWPYLLQCPCCPQRACPDCRGGVIAAAKNKAHAQNQVGWKM